MVSFLDNILIGIFSGLISGILVSRIFLIQENFQKQINCFEKVFGCVIYAKTTLEICKKILELKYDVHEEAKKEAEEKKYSSISEYYVRHSEQDWISAEDAVSAIRKPMDEQIKVIKSSQSMIDVKEKKLLPIYRNALKCLSEIQSLKDINFSNINLCIEKIENLEKDYQRYKKEYTKTLTRLMITDKVVVVFAVILIVVFVCCIILHFKTGA